jgi:putative ABC transport system ATP-binding protein
MSEILIEVSNLTKTYKGNESELTVLSEINFNIKKGETVAIIGPSGSGKTTLLGLCAGLDNPTSGAIKLAGKDISNLDEDSKADLRANEIGFIFQNFQLLPTLTALENVMIPMELKSMSNIKERAKDLLTRVGLRERMNHYPSQLSGGEQQRVSLARAFGNEPLILFADEPTGNLDGDTSLQIEALMFDLNKEKNTTLVIVTHNYELAEKTGRTIAMKSGKIVSDKSNQVTV